jgi:lysophospholipase L1-like esterase
MKEKRVLFMSTVTILLLMLAVFQRIATRGSKQQNMTSTMLITGAHALSTTTTKPNASRILCYGDSLTAGTTDDPFSLFPYAPHLEKALQEHGKTNVLVRHRGLPGWTTQMLLEAADGPEGLRTTIKAAQPLVLVILLAGTNDLGYTSDASAIVNNLIRLHSICHDEGVPKTLAIGVPPSGYQSVNDDARKLAQTVNEQLQQYCAQNPTRMTYVEFPFEFSRSEGNFAMDGLHFTPQGYKLFGESLVPSVESILDELEKLA